MENASWHGKLLPWLGAVLTGVLLFVSFPPLEWADAGWVALVPLLLACRGASPARAGRLGFLAGAVFWLAAIFWLKQATWPGFVFLALYCALYPGLFAALMARCLEARPPGSVVGNVTLMMAGALAWVGLEFIRSTLFTGFPWIPLGTSQYQNIPLIQLAGWGGVYAVSAVVVWINMAVALTIWRYTHRQAGDRVLLHPELLLGLLVVGASVWHGWGVVRRAPPAKQSLTVALIQPNIPQDDKWTADTVPMIYERLESLTRNALAAAQPDLVIWPETAIPDDLRTSAPSYNLVYSLVTNGVPILLGSMDTQWVDFGKPRYFNSSFLVGANGAMDQGYDKRHLVIFGEYIPLQRFVPFIRVLSPIQESFSPGATSTVFRLEKPAVRFSVLICFEDTLAQLARESVRGGARLLVNQTNDAWFDPYWASLQQMIQCVFRCVENGVPAVRATNTGLTCCVDRFGRVYDRLVDENGRHIFAGFRVSKLDLPPDNMPLTFYTRHGDVFAGSAAVLVLFGLAGMIYEKYFMKRRAGLLYIQQ